MHTSPGGSVHSLARHAKPQGEGIFLQDLRAELGRRSSEKGALCDGFGLGHHVFAGVTPSDARIDVLGLKSDMEEIVRL